MHKYDMSFLEVNDPTSERVRPAARFHSAHHEEAIPDEGAIGRQWDVGGVGIRVIFVPRIKSLTEWHGQMTMIASHAQCRRA